MLFRRILMTTLIAAARTDQPGLSPGSAVFDGGDDGVGEAVPRPQELVAG